MQIKFKIFAVFVFVFYIFFKLPDNVFAQILFEESFDNGYSNNWSVPRNTCSNNWSIVNNKYGIKTNGCITESVPANLVITPGTNYSFEADMTLTNSLDDRNFVFKYKDSNNWYGIHIYQNSLYVQKVVNGDEYFLSNRIYSYDFKIDNTYHFKIDVFNNDYYKIFIDNELLLTTPDQIPYFDNYSAGLQASGYSEVWFDNVVVTKIPDVITPSSTPTEVPTEVPTAVPTTVPTITPTVPPTPAPTIAPTPYPYLNVPNLKQYSLPWKDKIYGFTKKTIEAYGCALTSAAMILQYHGHNITPDTLNTWLKKETDGYIKEGFINWLAISRYTKLHDTSSSPSLEYIWLSPTNVNLDNELYNNRPSILKENGHYVVSTGKFGDTYTINDPGYSERKTLDSYDNSFLGITSYVPSHTDLSYMMFVINPGINIVMKNSLNQEVSSVSYTESPITNLLDSNTKLGENLKIVLFEKPSNGKYSLYVSGPKGNYELISYLYDINGQVTKNTFNGRLSGNDIDSFNINYDGKFKIKDKNKKSEFKFKFKDYFPKFDIMHPWHFFQH